MPLGQRIPHMPPEGRLGLGNALGKFLVGAVDVLAELKAGKIRAPASLACVGDVTDDAAEAAQAVLPARPLAQPPNPLERSMHY